MRISDWSSDVCSSDLQYFATDEARNAARIALIGEVANAWLLLAAAREKLSVAADTRDTFERTLVLTPARFERGYASALDVRQAQTSFAQARRQLPELTTAVVKTHKSVALAVRHYDRNGHLSGKSM